MVDGARPASRMTRATKVLVSGMFGMRPNLATRVGPAL